MRVLGSLFWNRFSRGVIDWLAINVVLYLALVAQVGVSGVCGGGGGGGGCTSLIVVWEGGCVSMRDVIVTCVLQTIPPLTPTHTPMHRHSP